MCPGYAYGTVANLETVGLPRCACGETLQPTELELAMLLGADDAPVMLEWNDRTERKLMGQKPALVRQSRGASVKLDDMGERAMREIVSERRERARRRNAAVRRVPEAIPF